MLIGIGLMLFGVSRQHWQEGLGFAILAAGIVLVLPSRITGTPMRAYQGYGTTSWRVDETYIKVGGKWKYLFRAVDKHGVLIDFMLSDRRNSRAAHRFLAKALRIMRDWPPSSITTDKLRSYPEAIERLKCSGQLPKSTKHRTSKYLNNIIEADHGALKRVIKPTRGFQRMKTATAYDQRLRDHAHDPTRTLSHLQERYPQ